MGMQEYDVFIAGGAVAGPVAAKFCAKQGLKTLLIEKAKVPRDKPCSGIQFPYFEKTIGDPIPPDRLCHNTLSKVEMHFPNGRVTQVNFHAQLHAEHFRRMALPPCPRLRSRIPR